MKTEQRFDSIGRLIRPRPHDEKIFAKDWQREILLGYFDKNPYPTREVLQELEKKVELDFQWLRNWYQYQRKRRNIRQDQYFKSLKTKEQFILDGEPELADFGDSTDGDVPATPEAPGSSKKMIKSQDWQKDILLEYFSRNAYPTREEVTQMESKTKLGSVWIKSWFQTKRKKEKNLKIKSENRDAEEKVTLSEDTQLDESLEKEAEGSDEKTEMYEKLKTKFEELQSRYNVLAELLLQRSILTAQNDQVAAKVPTVDLTESSSSSSSEPAEQMAHYPPAAVSSYPPPHPPPHPTQSYPYHPHYYPPYYPPLPPQYAQFYPHPHPVSRPPGGSLPYPPIPQ